MKTLRAIVIFSALALIAFAVTTYIKNQVKLPPSIEINTEGQPTLGYGEAKVHVVVFEEPKCSHCKRFHDEIYPKLKKNYIDTNKIMFTVIPVSFLAGSMPAANALLCTYNQDPEYPNPELFFTFLGYLYEHQPSTEDWTTPEKLEAMAKEASPAIQTEKFEQCVETENYRLQIGKNTEYGNQIMGHLVTPAVYVNGIKVEMVSYEEISSLIDTVRRKHGAVQ